ncbi:MAG TPA: type III secretion system export apparatus subunit SctT [Ramlibacter sp.]|uniref:type III secretion system export apparatus subunit SctT n=1 Tax=Ramlibacter sp. TaxID=1917967 RepID=UPI002D41D2C4|nr:type III secretion system export apparatus subunit SctT [Ramlibacter sp.]HZY20520.1 type III secretion system export apparatus subunit SctT [Ramlibacter sp.]
MYTETKAFVLALAWTQPRLLAMFVPIPIFNRQLLPGLLRMSVAAALGLVVAPTLMPAVAASELGGLQILMLIVKEAFVGFVLGYLVAIPFWAFEAIGFLIDNQRGASIAATLNPLTGNDSSPLGVLFNQAFIVFFFVSGGFLLMLDLLYDSYRLWDVFTWAPTLRAETVPLLLDQLSRLVRVALLLAAPAVVAMLLAEVGLALVSRFVPQLQVFFLAMPIKSALALLVLVLYMATLFEHGVDQLQQLRKVIPTLEGQWRTGVPR